MKMINVLNLMAEGKIKEGTKLEFDGYEYEFSEDHFEDGLGGWLEDVHEISASFLNIEVELIPPKPKKYQLKLYEDDDFSYVTRSSYDSGFNYDISDKNEICEFITKFTQEEIDSEKLLKFVEKYGIKEEVEENEID